jgi:hypothetical protein
MSLTPFFAFKGALDCGHFNLLCGMALVALCHGFLNTILIP